MTKPLTAPLIVDAAEFVLRVLDETSLDEIAAIESSSHAHPWTRTALRSSLTSHYCVGLFHQQSCIGYAVLSFVVGEAELLLFVLHAPWRGRGIATAFLQRLLEVAQARARCLFLEVRQSNARAITLYENLGFNQVGLRPNYYPGKGARREDALLYAIELM